MPEPTHEERTGARIYKATREHSKSDREQYHKETVEKADDASGAIDNVHTMVRTGVGVTRPTGQHVEVPHGGNYYVQDPPPGAAPDPFVGLAAGVAMVAEARRVLRERKKRRQDGIG